MRSSAPSPPDPDPEGILDKGLRCLRLAQYGDLFSDLDPTLDPDVLDSIMRSRMEFLDRFGKEIFPKDEWEEIKRKFPPQAPPGHLSTAVLHLLRMIDYFHAAREGRLFYDISTSNSQRTIKAALKRRLKWLDKFGEAMFGNSWSTVRRNLPEQRPPPAFPPFTKAALKATAEVLKWWAALA